jgi:hypothetical protein
VLEIDDMESDVYDQILMTEPMVIKEGELGRAKIIGKKQDNNGNLIGKYDHNPTLNTQIYLADFPDGHIMEVSANSIIEAIYSNKDEDGTEHTMFVDIIDHEKETH